MSTARASGAPIEKSASCAAQIAPRRRRSVTSNPPSARPPTRGFIPPDRRRVTPRLKCWSLFRGGGLLGGGLLLARRLLARGLGGSGCRGSSSGLLRARALLRRGRRSGRRGVGGG